MIASVAGIMAAAPTPSAPLARISSAEDGANAARSDAAPNSTRPITNNRWWPMRSPKVPAPSNRPATTRGYMLMIHSFSEVDAPSAWVSVGKAM